MDCARGKPYTNSETLSGMCQNDPYTFLINCGYNVSQKHFGTRAKYRRQWYLCFICTEFVFLASYFLCLYLQNTAAELGCTKTQLESTAFDVQFFISEHAQDLSPNQSKQLLRLLNTTQKSFQEVQEAITSQVESLETQLKAAQELGDQKVCLSV